MENVDYTDTFIAVAPDMTATSGGRSGAAAAGTDRGVGDLRTGYAEPVPAPVVRGDLHRLGGSTKGIPAEERDAAWGDFFAKPRACLRSSDLGKRFGWGLHADALSAASRYPGRCRRRLTEVTGELGR
jgi:hypothetical protein